ncbi:MULTISPECIES: MAB_1171c family putative transporter [Streptomyces]|uniref:MAB_1171c family putative transporter n=1 Tax=Streptomyces TaxID=1883 RepID=UPI000F658057|nr:MAB_1171c family putative transporter [Streptomyces alboflavus]
MNSVRYPLAALVCWLAFARTLTPILRHRRREPAVVALCASFGCQGMYLAMSAPAHWTGSLFGTVTWYNVSVQMWIIAVIACQQVLLIHWLYPADAARARARRAVAVIACVPVAMAVLFQLATTHGHPHNSFAHPGEQPYFVAYEVVYLTAFALGKAVVARACWFYAGRTEDTWVRRGLRTAAVGAGLDLVYSLGRFADVFLVHLGWDPSLWANTTRTSLTLGMALNTIGWTAPLWGQRLDSLRAWCADFRSYRRLRPLWYALHRAHPETSLHTDPRGDLSALWDLRFALHRRVIEIRDGCLALRVHQTSGPAPAPPPDSTERERAAWEAAGIAAALAAESGGARAADRVVPIAAPAAVAAPDRADGLAVTGQAGDPGSGAAGGPASDTAGDPAPGIASGRATSPGDLDFSSDVRWLVQVSRAFAALPERERRTPAG